MMAEFEIILPLFCTWLSLFFRLDLYGEMFVLFNRESAKVILKFALEKLGSFIIQFKENFFLDQSEWKKILKLPFCVLENVFNYTSAQKLGVEKSKFIRDQALSIGIIDHVLVALSFLTNQTHKFATLRSEPQNFNSIVR